MLFMTTQPACIINSKNQTKCYEVHESMIPMLIAPLTAKMTKLTDIVDGINRMQYPWNLDDYRSKWDAKTGYGKPELVKQTLKVSYFEPDKFIKDISFAELKQNPKQFDQFFGSNTLIIDLPRKQVINLTSSGSGYAFIPAMLRMYKHNDPKVKKAIKKCEWGQKKGMIPHEISCSDLSHEMRNPPKDFQMITVDLTGDSDGADLSLVKTLAEKMYDCNPNGTILNDMGKCLFQNTKNVQKDNWMLRLKEIQNARANKLPYPEHDFITYWK